MDAARAVIRVVLVWVVHARAPPSPLFSSPRLAIGVFLLEENRLRVHRRRRRRVFWDRDMYDVQFPRFVEGHSPVEIGFRVFRFGIFLVVWPCRQQRLMTTTTDLPVFVHE